MSLQVAPQPRPVRRVAVPEERLQRRRQLVERQPADVFAERDVVGVAQGARLGVKGVPALLAQRVLRRRQLDAQAVEVVATLRRPPRSR